MNEPTLESESVRLLSSWREQLAEVTTALGVTEDQVWARILRLREVAAKTVEVRMPDTGWCKRVSAVSSTAKTGYDWTGPFLQRGRLVDLPPGSLLVWGGEAEHPVDLGSVLPEGEIDWWCGVRTKHEWAITLRNFARRYLDSPENREQVIALGRDYLRHGRENRRAIASVRKLQDETHEIKRQLRIPTQDPVLRPAKEARLAEIASLISELEQVGKSAADLQRQVLEAIKSI